MVERKTMRPVTLRRVIEICSLVTKTKAVKVANVSQDLGVSPSRAREIVCEVQKMGLLENQRDAYATNDKTIKLLEYFENEQWHKIHEYFLDNYQFYRNFVGVLKDYIDDNKGLSLNQIKDESMKRKLNLNQTSVEVLSDWCERLGVIQRHLFAKRLYLIKNDDAPIENFKSALIGCYRTIAYCRKGAFVEIPKLREDVCERLKLNREIFDEMLRTVYLENIGKIELSGAPIITLAKKSPLSERKMEKDAKHTILCPRFELTRERGGLIVGRKTYYYLAVHEEI